MIQDRRNLQVYCHNDHSKQYAANLFAAEVSAVVIAMPLLLSNAMQRLLTAMGGPQDCVTTGGHTA